MMAAAAPASVLAPGGISSTNDWQDRVAAGPPAFTQAGDAAVTRAAAGIDGLEVRRAANGECMGAWCRICMPTNASSPACAHAPPCTHWCRCITCGLHVNGFVKWLGSGRGLPKGSGRGTNACQGYGAAQIKHQLDRKPDLAQDHCQAIPYLAPLGATARPPLPAPELISAPAAAASHHLSSHVFPSARSPTPSYLLLPHNTS